MARPVTIAPVNFTLIRHEMKQRKFTMKRMAGKLGVHISQLSEILSGLRPCNDERLAIISDELKKPHHYFKTSIGRMVANKVDADLVDWSLSPERGDVKETDLYLDVTERMGYLDFTPELPDETGIQNYDFWKKDEIIPFRSDKCLDFWEFDGDEILIRGPARCGKSTLILEWLFSSRFRDDTERKNSQQICEYCFGLISPIPGDVTANDEETAFSSSTLRLRIKAGSLLIYGEDIRDQISLPPLDQHIRDVMFRAYVFCFTDRLRPNLKARVYPLDYPDPSDEFYGYTYKNGTTVFASVVGAVATAIVASKAKKYVFTKNDSLKLYKKYINDEWTTLLEVAFEKIRKQWEYQIPENKEERQQLREICRRTLAFENHFLIIYKDFLLTELRDAEDKDKLLAVERLGEIIYPDGETLDALKALESCANREMREVVNNTISWIRQMKEKN